MNADLFENKWNISQAYATLWAFQAALLSVRSLALFQTSRYFGVMLRIILQLFAVLVKFLIILLVLLLGFTFGLYYIQGGYDDSENNENMFEWYIAFKYLFQLTVGAGDFAEIEDIVDKVTAQIFTMIYIVFGTILMINLLIALMTTTFENIHKKAVTESVFARVEMTYDLSNRSRFMPAPLCIYVMFLSVLLHVINFIPALLCPKRGNIYNCIHHRQYRGLVNWKCSVNGCCRCAKNKKHDDLVSEDRKFFLCCKSVTMADEYEDMYKLTTRGRVWKYYASTVFCIAQCTPKWIQKILKKQRFEIHHNGCYASIPTEIGAKMNTKNKSNCHGITFNEYIEEYQKCHNISLDPQDVVLLKHLVVDTLFCKHCYRPFVPENVHESLLTPFWSLSELLVPLIFISQPKHANGVVEGEHIT